MEVVRDWRPEMEVVRTCGDDTVKKKVYVLLYKHHW